MTSKDTQQPANTASNNIAAPAATSYASAAGAVKKPSSTPVVATGSNPPVVAAGSSAHAPNHAKSSSTSPMNGRQNIMPAVPVPAVAHGTSTVNGQPDHNRKSSVTIGTNGPNYSANGTSAGVKSNIQFGYQDSPAASHSTPQMPSAHVAIPASNRVVEPRAEPTPIPQPSASGGRPPSGATTPGSTLAFGSFDDTQSHNRNPSASHDPSNLGPQHTPHMRRGSNVSDISNHGPQAGGMGRGSFSGGSRGGRAHGGGYNNSVGGYPPSFRNQQGNQGRGGMPQNYPNNGRPHYGGPPPQQSRSPAISNAVPHSVPSMGPNMAPNMGGPPPFYYTGHVAPNQVHQQMFPIPNPHPLERIQPKNKRKGSRRDSEKCSQPHRRVEPLRHDLEVRSKRCSRRLDLRFSMMDERQRVCQIPYDRIDSSSVSDSSMLSFPHNFPIQPPMAQELAHLDLSPESGNFDRLLTSVKQGYYNPQFDPRNNMQHMGQMPPMAAYPGYQGMHPAGSPMTPYQQPYAPAPYGGQHQMSRSSSQISDHRPASSAGQNQVPIPQGTPQPSAAQVKPPAVQFTRPAKKSAAITIKNEAGETVDFKSLKPPASPASTSHQSRTPPVVSSTPTPPPKSSTPKSFISAHARTDSTSNSKTAEEKRNEFREKIQQTATGDKDKEEDVAKALTDKTALEPQPTAAAAQDESKVPEKAKEDVDAKATEEGTKQAEAPAPAPQTSEKPAEPAEDDIEAIIREMEEADARREKEEEERQQKRQAEAAEKKKSEEASRLANAAENDRKLREQEAEMERLEDEKEKKRAAAAQGAPTESAAELLKKKADAPDATPKDTSSSSGEVTGKLASLSLNDKSASTSGAKGSPSGRAPKPQALNLGTLSSLAVEPAQPSAALQSLKTARLLDVINADIYPEGIKSPNPALNAAVTKKGTSFKYDPVFLMQFKSVFTEQPNEGFHTQVKNLIGDGDGGRSASNRSGGGPGRQNTRGSTSGFQIGAMGSFTTSGTSTLPPGSTSSQRFEMSNKAMAGRTSSGLGLGNFQRPGGAFAGGSSMSRTPSSNMGSMPHSSRQTSRRNASKPNTINAKAEAQAAKNMPLTQGMKIDQLQISSSGWKPTSIGKGPSSSNLAGQSALMEPAMVQRKVKAALNKMTPENFDRISDQILEIAAQSKEETDGRTLRQVIQLTFEKATDEAHWASMYAKFCKKMLETMSPDIRDESIKDRSGKVVSGGALFRKYLLNRCQEEFQRGWKIELPEPKEGEDPKSAAAALLSDEYYLAAAAKRRGLGLIQFIGELFKLGMLTERIMHECVRKLVDYSGVPDEAEVESLWQTHDGCLFPTHSVHDRPSWTAQPSAIHAYGRR
ncbi:hypothetical protein NPX13_g3317 [Xylaria arbuscula]|uniref:MIF4G domain-containing protein n=1 Tax=Xylaria arbuscula TaxID=114810 RepID=A0A9W8NIR9_9PEZI|nr:hypothetical protein NPX13_g3317 [Xylaria arbuscula]